MDSTPWGKRAIRVAIAIGQDADRAMLKEFLANPELEPLKADNPKQLARAIRWASTVAVRAASTPRADAVSALAAGPADPDDTADVW